MEGPPSLSAPLPLPLVPRVFSRFSDVAHFHSGHRALARALASALARALARALAAAFRGRRARHKAMFNTLTTRVGDEAMNPASPWPFPLG